MVRGRRYGDTPVTPRQNLSTDYPFRTSVPHIALAFAPFLPHLYARPPMPHDDAVYWTPFTTPLGTAYAASTRAGLCRLTLPGETEAHFTVWLHDHFDAANIRPHPEPNLDVIEQVDAYWKGARTRFELRLDLRGTSFQRAVWDRLLHIPFGQTVTYSELAEAAGAPQGYQAAGAAVGQNPVRLVVPCHRVLSADGGLTGFASGIATKQWLLRHEGALLL